MKKDKQWYLDNFGEKDGFSRWLRGSSLEAYIFKFGEKDGTIKFNGMKSARKGRGNLQWFINKYGEIKGPIKYREKNVKLSVGLEKLIETHGLEKALEIKEKHSKNSARTLDNYIKKYGEIEGTKKFNNKKKNSIWKKSYWIEQGLSENDAIEKVSDLQRRDKTYFINKYGFLNGMAKYEESCFLRSHGLDAWKARNGEELGLELYNQWKENQQGKGNLQWFINKYGEIEGPIKYREINYKKTINEQKFIEKYGEIGAQLYHEMVIKRSMAIRACVSKPELELGMAINEMFPADDIRFNDTQVTIGLRRSEAVILGQRAIKPDILIANKKIIIEFYGDIFHAHSRFIDTVFPCPWIQLTAKEIRQHDQAKIKLLEKYGYTVFIVWEYDWRKNKNLVLKNLREKINEIKK